MLYATLAHDAVSYITFTKRSNLQLVEAIIGPKHLTVSTKVPRCAQVLDSQGHPLLVKRWNNFHVNHQGTPPDHHTYMAHTQGCIGQGTVA